MRAGLAVRMIEGHSSYNFSVNLISSHLILSLILYHILSYLILSHLILSYLLLKTGLFYNAKREFSLAKPSWYMSHYTMIYKNGERMRNILGLFVFIVV